MIHARRLLALAAMLPAMARADCLFLGDSIALGASRFAPQCKSLAKTGISSPAWLAAHGAERLSADVVVISLGSNDGALGASQQAMFAIRRRVEARRVMWIAPGAQFASRIAAIQVASLFGDVVFERPVEQLGPDGVHFTPDGYRRIALLATR